jgi:hypothetical protein
LAARFSWPWSAERRVQVLRQTAVDLRAPALPLGTSPRVRRARSESTSGV